MTFYDLDIFSFIFYGIIDNYYQSKGKIEIMLTKFFTISLRTLTLLEKIKEAFDKWLAPLALLLLGIAYFFIEINRQAAIILAIISLFLIFTYLILEAYLFVRIRFFLWKNRDN